MSSHIDVDPIRCKAHGLCAELLPERITLDEWGYPLIDPAPIPASLQGLARRTVNACPTLALRLRAATTGANGSGGGGVRAPGRPSRSRTAG
jgi:ferredoxin